MNRGGKKPRKGRSKASRVDRLKSFADPSEGLVIGHVLKELGSGAFSTVIDTVKGKQLVESRSIIRGALRKVAWIGVGDLVLVQLNDYDGGSNKNTNIAWAKYNSSDYRQMIKMGVVSKTFQEYFKKSKQAGGEEEGFEFGDEDKKATEVEIDDI